MTDRRLARALLTATVAAGALGLTGLFGYGFTFFCGNWIPSGSTAEYWINPNFRDASAGSDVQQENAIRTAADTWTGTGGAQFSWELQGRTTRASIAPDDGRSDVFSLEQSNGNVLAVTVCDGTSVHHGGDILFYDQGISWNLLGNFDIRTVALHELGHLLGLGHSTVAGAVMRPGYEGIRRALTTDDRDGIQAIYGVGIAPVVMAITPPTGPVRGGTTVTIDGSSFVTSATVTFDGVPATVVSRSDTQLVVWAPQGMAVDQVAAVGVTQGPFTTTLPAAYAYHPNPIDLSWTGLPQVGETVTLHMYGPPGMRGALAIGAPGTTERFDLSWCVTGPYYRLFRLSQIDLGLLGQAEVPVTLNGVSAFTTLSVAGALAPPGSGRDALVQTPCTSLTVFP